MKKIYYTLLVIAVSLFVVACSASDKGEGNYGDGGSGKGGSMARFTIVGDYIYTVNSRSLKIANISNPSNPIDVGSKNLWNSDIETIYPWDGKLLIGSQSAFYIVDLTDPTSPEVVQRVSHIKSCDPIIAKGNIAYVTLNNARINCGNRGNWLQVYDVSDIEVPIKLRDIQLLDNVFPSGLDADAEAGRLFVCTSKGVKVYDLTEDPGNPLWMDDLAYNTGVGAFNAYDCIALGGLLIVIGEDGLYQFDYTGEKIEPVSMIDLR